MRRALIAAVITITCSLPPARAADAAFTQFIASLWPEAQAAGVSRATFEQETRGLEPDYKLPDLILPGRPATGAPSQAEFVQVPADYVREASIARLAGEGQLLLQKYRPALTEIEKSSGVPATVMLAIWGRETDYGRYTLPYDLVRVLATQAYVGRRKDTYRNEFILSLKILGDGVVTRKDMRSSWAGATGLTQFLPSEYYKHGVDFDRDGRIDIWHSVPDALASAAQQLGNKGWQSGVRWAYEVQAPAKVDCTSGVPEVTKPIGQWLREGFVPVRGQKLSAAEQTQPASLLQPEGIYGPSFLTTKNYFVIKELQFLRSLRAVRRPSQRPHDEPAAVRDAVVGLEAIAYQGSRDHAARADARRALQGQDRRQGRHADARRAWCLSKVRRPQGRLLAERRGAALDSGGAIAGLGPLAQRKSPAEMLGRALIAALMSAMRSDQ
ncbi:lytic murein transglycosylase [Bradyrhizobium sp. LM6.10]